MNDLTPYSSSSELIADKVRWSIATLDRLVQRGRSEGWLDGSPVAATDPEDLAREILARLAVTSWAVAPMQWLAARLGLGETELDALWLLTCIELSPAAARLAQVFATTACLDLTVQILMELVPISSKQLESLQAFGLIELSSDVRVPHHRRGVRANDRVIELARGELELDRELRALATVHLAADPSGEVPASLVTAIESTPAPFVVAIGPEGAGRATLLANVAARAGHGTLRVRTRELAGDAHQLKRQLRAIVREACLLDTIPLFEDVDVDPEHPATTMLERELRAFPGPVLATAAEAVRWSDRPVICHEVKPLDLASRRACWRSALANAPEAVVEAAAQQYSLRPGAIIASARNVVAASTDLEALAAETIQAGVRAHLGEQIGSLATRIEWRQSWEDLVLPVDPFEQVVELVARVRHRGHVLDTWGFGDKIGKGHGVAALFSGPPGTGKTMVAGLIAQELGLDLYQVDLSKIVSKYIGETEKKLAALFDAAESGQAIILFDEADSLFGKRSEVKSSNDRYANLETNYLLQRIEAFTGISLLTTNHESSIDDAFRRRLALHVRFPMPDEAQRAQLWRAMLPAKAEVAADIDFGHLARTFEMSGGFIKNAVVRAAYLAVDAGSVIAMAQLWKAARAEYEGMGKVVYQRAA
jgi:predicted ABC-type ATPase